MNYEKVLLGGIIKTPYLIDQVLAKLTPEDFITPGYREIFAKIVDLYSKKEFLDYFTLEESFSDESFIKLVRELGKSSHEFEKEELNQYLKHIKEAKRTWALKNIGGFLIDSKNYANNTIDKLVTEVAHKLFNLTESSLETDITSEKLVEEMKKEIELYKGKDLWGFSTGYRRIDSATRGFQKGQLWVVGAYTSIGKSWFCLNLANNALKDGAKVLYLSTEMVETRLAWRLTAINTGIPEFDMIQDRLTPESKDRRDSALQSILTSPIRIISGITRIDEVIFYAKREIADKGLDVVVVDFLQNLAGGKDEYEELSNAIRKLQNLALSEKICVIVASQVSRESQKAGTSGAFGYKGSGTIEACADLGIVLKRKEDSKNELVVDVKKNRNGFTFELELDADFKTGKMKEYA